MLGDMSLREDWKSIMKNDQDRLLDVNDVATLLHAPLSWVYTNAEAGTLPSLKIGKYRRFKLIDIQSWMEAQRQAQPRVNGFTKQ